MRLNMSLSVVPEGDQHLVHLCVFDFDSAAPDEPIVNIHQQQRLPLPVRQDQIVIWVIAMLGMIRHHINEEVNHGLPDAQYEIGPEWGRVHPGGGSTVELPGYTLRF